jgi:hypothetical protein
MACISSSVSIGVCIILMFDLHSFARVGWYSRYVRRFIGQRHRNELGSQHNQVLYIKVDRQKYEILNNNRYLAIC